MTMMMTRTIIKIIIIVIRITRTTIIASLIAIKVPIELMIRIITTAMARRRGQAGCRGPRRGGHGRGPGYGASLIRTRTIMFGSCHKQ